MVEEFLMTHRTGMPHIHEAPHTEGEEAAAQEAPAASEAVCVHLSRLPVLACTLIAPEQRSLCWPAPSSHLWVGLSSLGWFCRAGLRAILCLLFLDSSGDGNLFGHLPSRQALSIPTPILCHPGRGLSSRNPVWGHPLALVLSL